MGKMRLTPAALQKMMAMGVPRRAMLKITPADPEWLTLGEDKLNYIRDIIAEYANRHRCPACDLVVEATLIEGVDMPIVRVNRRQDEIKWYRKLFFIGKKGKKR